MSRLRFLHIPKTAGTTFVSILRRQYRGKGYFNFTGDYDHDLANFTRLSVDEKRRIELIAGHAPIATGMKEFDDATIITFLRHPVSRVKSFCQYVSEGKCPYLLKEFPPEKFDLDRFLESGNAELFNLQTKMLLNSGECTSPVIFQQLGPSSARDLALENLFTRIAHFGLQEYFDESLILFSTALEWRTPLYVSKNKKNRARLLEFKEHHVARITELNSVDMEVYDSAKAKFMAIVNSEKFDRAKLEQFRTLQKVLSPPMRAWSNVTELSLVCMSRLSSVFRGRT